MSERTEKHLSRSERPVVTPQPSRQSFFDWIEDKFNGREAMPRYFELKVAANQSGTQYRPDTLHQKEFKPNIKKPEREEMVELSNKFVAVAQEHCNEVGRPQGYVVLAINHIKGAHPYGVYFMKLRPTQFQGLSHLDTGSGSDEEILSDGMHRDLLLRHSLEHQKANDEHARFMQDGLQRSTASILQLQQEIIRELRLENNALKGQQLDWYKAVQSAHDTTLEREMKAAQNKVKMEIIERGAGLLLQMVPVVAKTLERNKNGGALPENGSLVGPSPESVAIEQFVRTLSEAQKVALFGQFDQVGNHVPGIFTSEQVRVFADVGELKVPPSLLQALLPGGPCAITAVQIAKAQEHVPMDQLMPLYAMIQEGQAQDQAQNQANATDKTEESHAP